MMNKKCLSLFEQDLQRVIQYLAVVLFGVFVRKGVSMIMAVHLNTMNGAYKLSFLMDFCVNNLA